MLHLLRVFIVTARHRRLLLVGGEWRRRPEKEEQRPAAIHVASMSACARCQAASKLPAGDDDELIGSAMTTNHSTDNHDGTQRASRAL